MHEPGHAIIAQDIAHLDRFIASKLQLLSNTRNREDRELLEIQITDLEKRRRELSRLLSPVARGGGQRRQGRPAAGEPLPHTPDIRL